MRETTSLWFIPCYLFADILLFVVVGLFNKFLDGGGKIWCLLVLKLVLTMSLVLVLKDYAYVQRFFVALFFFNVGFVINYSGIIEKTPVLVSCGLLALGSWLSQVNGMVSIAKGVYGNYLIYFLVAFLMSFSILSLFSSVENSTNFNMRLLKMFGINTIVVLCTNNLLVEIVHILDYKLFGNILMNEYRLVFTIVLVVLEMQIILLAERKLRFLFGK